MVVARVSEALVCHLWVSAPQRLDESVISFSQASTLDLRVLKGGFSHIVGIAFLKLSFSLQGLKSLQ